MADNIRLKWNRSAMYDIRRDPELVNFLESMGQTLRDEANATLPENTGYRMSSSQGRKNPQGRWAVRVFTSSDHAKNSNAKHNTLVRMLRVRY
jgi:hypothetical protein